MDQAFPTRRFDFDGGFTRRWRWILFQGGSQRKAGRGCRAEGRRYILGLLVERRDGGIEEAVGGQSD